MLRCRNRGSMGSIGCLMVPANDNSVPAVVACLTLRLRLPFGRTRCRSQSL